MHNGMGLPGPDDHVDAWEELAVDYLDGRLGEEQRAVVAQHLEGCAACQARVDEQWAMASLARAVPEMEPPPGLEAAVLEKLGLGVLVPFPMAEPAVIAEAGPATVALERAGDARRSPRSLRQRFFGRPRVWLPAAAALLLVAVTLASLPAAQRAARQTGTADKAMVSESGSGQTTTATLLRGATTTSAAGRSTSGPSAGGALTTALPTAPPAGRSTVLGTQSSGVGAAGTVSGSGALAPTGPAQAPYLVEARSAFGTAASPAALVSTTLDIPPLPSSLWLEGPTFALFVPQHDVSALLRRLQSTGLDLTVLGHQSFIPGSPVAIIAHAWEGFPALVQMDVIDPRGPVFAITGAAGDSWEVTRGEDLLIVLTMSY
jgi:hypothetical protein